MKQFLKTSLVVLSAAMVSATVTFAGDLSGVIKIGDSSLGHILTDNKGMTLYTFDKDSNGKSACNGGCAKAWPPLLAEASPAETDEFTKITRDDGEKQWAYKGMPLYGWVNDKQSGDVTGDKFKGVWHVVTP
ncbi:hypothetical protein [Kiloniella antarctica]|uniref:Lipoprotein n=1 Tax=Kiloniella antarctica TaxID=1550907 RepID=A0ABW5BM43_9PROT